MERGPLMILKRVVAARAACGRPPLALTKERQAPPELPPRSARPQRVRRIGKPDRYRDCAFVRIGCARIAHGRIAQRCWRSGGTEARRVPVDRCLPPGYYHPAGPRNRASSARQPAWPGRRSPGHRRRKPAAHFFASSAFSRTERNLLPLP